MLFMRRRTICAIVGGVVAATGLVFLLSKEVEERPVIQRKPIVSVVEGIYDTLEQDSAYVINSRLLKYEKTEEGGVFHIIGTAPGIEARIVIIEDQTAKELRIDYIESRGSAKSSGGIGWSSNRIESPSVGYVVFPNNSPEKPLGTGSHYYGGDKLPEGAIPNIIIQSYQPNCVLVGLDIYGNGWMDGWYRVRFESPKPNK